MRERTGRERLRRAKEMFDTEKKNEMAKLQHMEKKAAGMAAMAALYGFIESGDS